jgi:hypothetical protein
MASPTIFILISCEDLAGSGVRHSIAKENFLALAGDADPERTKIFLIANKLQLPKWCGVDLKS